MMVLQQLRDIIQEDVGQRGLGTVPDDNLITACPDDFALACRSIAEHVSPWVAIVTGFYIPTAQPPAGETDGPLGALFLARAWTPLGIRVVIVTDAFCTPALEAGLAAADLNKRVNLITLPSPEESYRQNLDDYWNFFKQRAGAVTHLVALERVGPSHTLASLHWQLGASTPGQTYLDFLTEVPDEHQDRCHTMRGLDITANMSPAHWLFEIAPTQNIATIGIGDGGNEIGMGKIPWPVLRANIPRGGLVACRVPTQNLIVCGVSNWGAYALALGVCWLREKIDPGLFDTDRHRQLLQEMVSKGPLVDGVTTKPTATVDGLKWETYIGVLGKMRETLGASRVA